MVLFITPEVYITQYKTMCSSLIHIYLLTISILIFNSLVQKTMHEQMMKLKKISDAGKLDEHLEMEPHFLSTTLCDDAWLVMLNI
jgi:hypothetical protein